MSSYVYDMGIVRQQTIDTGTGLKVSDACVDSSNRVVLWHPKYNYEQILLAYTIDLSVFHIFSFKLVVSCYQ